MAQEINHPHHTRAAPARSDRRDPSRKRRISDEERARRRIAAGRAREAERRSLTVLNDMAPEPRIDSATLAARRAEIPDDDPRDLTALVFGDPNPADTRRRQA